MPNDDFHKIPTIPGAADNDVAPFQTTKIPDKIGPYKIECLLEKGGMSILYLALHPETKEPTTIKVLSPKFLSHPDVVQRFLNEAEIIAITDHPNIVKLYGHGEWEGGLYIAMEYIEGISLRQALLQRPISLKRALEIIIDIAYALCHLHTHGVIHRDLKPENILITDDNEVKVIDFGISQLLTENSVSGKPSHQRVIGTPIYMSPEQRENPENVSYPSDIYSLGIIAYELVIGKLSHGQIHLSLLPKGLQKILTKTLQPRPQDRYHDVVDFITDVSAYLNSTNLTKERKAGDQLSEISENLRATRNILIPSSPPKWPGIDISLSNLKGESHYGIYYDFFHFPDNSFGITLGESSAKSAEGVIYAATIRGMVQVLVQQTKTPSEVAYTLNSFMLGTKNDEFFTFCYLWLQPEKQSFTFISCGESNLWRVPRGTLNPIKIKSDNIALGIDKNTQFVEVTSPWEKGDFLLISSFTPDTMEETAEHFFEKAIRNRDPSQPTQKILDAILLKAKLHLNKPFYEHTLSLIGIVREEDT